MEWSFLQVMRTSRKQYCESAVDRRWRKAMEKKIKQKKSMEERQKQILAQTIMLDVGMQTESETNNESTDNDDATFVQNVLQEDKNNLDLLISKYHCSKTQAIAAVIETGRVMFGRSNGKFHTQNQELIDLDIYSP